MFVIVDPTSVVTDQFVKIKHHVDQIKHRIVEQGFPHPSLLERKSDALGRAHRVMQAQIDQAQTTLERIAASAERQGRMALARYDAKTTNNAGALMSMRKYHKLQADYQLQHWLWMALQQLDRDIAEEAVRVNRYEIELKVIHDFHTIKSQERNSEAVKNEALLLELASGDFMHVSIPQRACTVGLSRPTNPAA